VLPSTVLTQDQRGDCMSACGDLINSANKDGMFLNQIITGDETWCFLYNLELMQQSTAWKSPSSSRQKKLQQDGSEGKVMFELIWNCSLGIYPRRIDCKQAPLQRDPLLSMQFILL
jgi:hypothetical protein